MKDSVEGLRVLTEFLKITKPQLIHKTGRHRGQRARLYGTNTRPVYCVVERELNFVKD